MSNTTTKLLPVSNINVLKPGCEVQMKDGEILKVKSLEHRHFTAIGRNEYIPKRDIHTIIDHK